MDDIDTEIPVKAKKPSQKKRKKSKLRKQQMLFLSV